MSAIEDGLYTIAAPGGACITNTQGGTRLHLLPPGASGHDSCKILVTKRGPAYTFRFIVGGSVGFETSEPGFNAHAIASNTPWEFLIESADYDPRQATIRIARDPNYTLGPALERIYPPWVAMVNFQPMTWTFNRVG